MKRRGRIITLCVLLAILLAIVGVYLYFFAFNGLEAIVVHTIEGDAGEDSPFEVEIGNISGSLVKDVVIEDLRISYRDSSGLIPLVSVTRLTAVYSLSNIWNQQFLFDDVYADSLVITLVKGPDGGWKLPLPGSEDVKVGDNDSLAVSDSTAAASPLEFAVKQLALSQSTIRLVKGEGDTTDIRNISLLTSISGEAGMYSADIKRLDFAAGGMPGGTRISGKVSFSNNTLVVQDLQLVRGSTRIKISGTFDPDAMSGAGHVSADHIDLEELTGVTGGNLKGVLDLTGNVSYVNGRISGQVTVGGTFLFAGIENLFIDFGFEDKVLSLDTVYGTIFETCAIDGRCEVNLDKPEKYWLDADIRNFDLSRMLPNTFGSNLTGHLRLDGNYFTNEELLLDLYVNLFESSFDDYPLHAANGHLTITTEAVTFPDPFEVVYYENRFTAEGEVDYDGDLRIEVDGDLPNLDRWRGKLFIDQPGGRAQAHAVFSGKTSDPDLHGSLTSDSLWVYGLYTDSFSGAYDIERFLTGRKGTVTADLGTGAAWDVPFDSGRVDLSLDSLIVGLDNIRLTSTEVSVFGAGSLNQEFEPQLLSLDTLDLGVFGREFYNMGNLDILIDTLGFDLRRTQIGNGPTSLMANGRIDYDESMNLRFEVNKVSIGSWLPLFDKERELKVDGYLSGAADLAGRFVEPSFVVDAAIDSLTYRNTGLGELTVSAQYSDKLLTIDSLVVFSDPGQYKATGYLYADLSFDATTVERFPDRPFDIRVNASDTRFDLVTLTLPSVEDLKGEFVADVHLTGTPNDPHLEGEALLVDGNLKYFDIVNHVKTDSARVRMRDNQIILDQVTCYIEDKGRKSKMYIDGDITVQSLDTLEYNLGISIPGQTTVKYELADIEARFSAELEVLGSTPPLVTGDVTLYSGRDRSPFPTGREGSSLMLSLSGEDPWDLDINVDISSNYWIKNADMDAEFSGYLNIIRESGRYRFAGEMDILRGRAYLFDRTFQIQEDSRVTFEDTEYPNPQLDITMMTRIAVPKFEQEDVRSEEELYLHVGGTLENPEFGIADAAGGSDLTEEDILPLLVANYYGSGPDQSVWTQRAMSFLSSQVSQIATRRLAILGVETFEIDPTYSGEFDLATARYTVGLYGPGALSNVYVYGRAPANDLSQSELGFEYRLQKGFVLEGRREIDDQARERYGVNFRLHWEF